MSGCTDNRFADMLYAYELGMLDGEERRALELHLLDCDHCFQALKEFRQEAHLMKHDQDVRQSIRTVVDRASDINRSRRLSRADEKDRKGWAFSVRTSLAAAAALILLILQPWHFEIHPQQTAIAAENRLAIMYFDNIIDPQDPDRLSDIATNLLITDLSESQFMDVVSHQRMHDALRLMGIDSARSIDRHVASQVAERVGARWMLTGSILQTEPHAILTAQLAEVSDGSIIAAQRVAGTAGESIFDLVDRLSAEIKSDLALPTDALSEIDRMVVDFTTDSVQAYRSYLAGLESNQTYHRADARGHFREAVQIDTAFSMAWYQLAALEDYPLNVEAIDRAERHIDRVSRRVAFLIKTRKALLTSDYVGALAVLDEAVQLYPLDKEMFYRIGVIRHFLRKPAEALPYLKRAIEIDPLYKDAYNRLAYIYIEVDSANEAVEAVDRYVELAPDDANAWDSRGGIYASAGRVEEAIAAYRKALEIRPDFAYSMLGLGNLLLAERRYDESQEMFRKLASGPSENMRALGREHLVKIPFYQGKYEEALEVLDDVITAERVELGIGERAVFARVRSLIFREQGKLNLALQEAHRTQQLARQVQAIDSVYGSTIVSELLASIGDFEAAVKSTEIIRRTDLSYGWGLSGYHFAMGFIELYRDNLEKAEDYLLKSIREQDHFPARQVLGRVYLEMNRYDDAIAQLTTASRLSKGMPEDWGIVSIHGTYYLALAYQNSGRTADAIQHYEAFLEVFSEAEPGLKLVEDASERISRLRAAS